MLLTGPSRHEVNEDKMVCSAIDPEAEVCGKPAVNFRVHSDAIKEGRCQSHRWLYPYLHRLTRV